MSKNTFPERWNKVLKLYQERLKADKSLQELIKKGIVESFLGY